MIFSNISIKIKHFECFEELILLSLSIWDAYDNFQQKS